MSANEGRARRRRKASWLVLAGAVAVVGSIATVVVFAAQHERVDRTTVTIRTGPRQVAANAPVVSAPSDAKLAEVADATADLTATLSGDLGNVRSRSQGAQLPPPTLIPDRCLLEWETANLAALARTGAYEVMDVCGRPTVVLAGPAGADSKVLAYGAIQKSAPAGMRQLIAGSRNAQVAVAAVRSSDGEAQMLAVSMLPDSAADTVEPRLINSPPPGFGPYPKK